MKWTVEPLNTTVAEELLALPSGMRARFLRVAELLNEFGPQQVGVPHVRHLEGKLWEMRLLGKEGIGRAIYVATPGRRIVVLHAFVKKTEKTPRRALDLARRRSREVFP